MDHLLKVYFESDIFESNCQYSKLVLAFFWVYNFSLFSDKSQVREIEHRHATVNILNHFFLRLSQNANNNSIHDDFNGGEAKEGPNFT